MQKLQFETRSRDINSVKGLSQSVLPAFVLFVKSVLIIGTAWYEAAILLPLFIINVYFSQILSHIYCIFFVISYLEIYKYFHPDCQK